MFPENISNTLWFSGCLLGLILAGVILSGISRKQIGVFEGNNALVKKIKESEKVVLNLQLELRFLEERLNSKTKRANTLSSGLIRERSAQTTLNTQIQFLDEERNTLKSELPKLSSKFEAFRKDNLTQMRRKAVGEKLGSLYLKSGRMLEGVVILRVTDNGLQVRHTGGILKLSAIDLPNSFQERFQW
ncbi:MAG: hypothetical protein ACSHX9_01130 [Luteolibacter sp.]